MSLILRPPRAFGLRWSGLAALAVAEALIQEGLSARIKWPNDVLVGGRKVAGVLVEGALQGEQYLYVVLGIGINVGRESVPDEESLAFPATSVEHQARRKVSRPRLVAAVVSSLEGWTTRLASQAFLEAWDDLLAFKGDRVLAEAGPRAIEGRLVGLGPEGEARIELSSGESVLAGGESSNLRPAFRR
jgi:BirA family biotin operon repressor/biotin-[acetyl-CoA-carboxylase] ligase